MTDRQFLSLFYFVGGMAAYQIMAWALGRYGLYGAQWAPYFIGLALWWVLGRVYRFMFGR